MRVDIRGGSAALGMLSASQNVLVLASRTITKRGEHVARNLSGDALLVVLRAGVGRLVLFHGNGGNAALANAEAGAQLLDSAALGFVDFLQEFAGFDPRIERP